MALPNSAQKTQENSLEQLAETAATRKPRELPYAGEVTAAEAQAFIGANQGAVLMDVRTAPEWQVRVPDVLFLRKISWKNAPNYTLNQNFAAEFAAQNISKNTPVFFICHSGGRSLDAAIAMTEAGHAYCFNVSGGFESWKESQLPWKQG